MRRFYFKQGANSIRINFIIYTFLCYKITEYIHWYKLKIFLNWVKYCEDVHSQYEKENRENKLNNQGLEVELKEHMDENNFKYHEHKIPEIDLVIHRGDIYENIEKPYEKSVQVKRVEKIIEVENIEDPYIETVEVKKIEEPYIKIVEVENIEKPYIETVEVQNIKESYIKTVDMEEIRKPQKNFNQINQLGCEVDIPIDKIVAFIHNIT